MWRLILRNQASWFSFDPCSTVLSRTFRESLCDGNLAVTRQVRAYFALFSLRRANGVCYSVWVFIALADPQYFPNLAQDRLYLLLTGAWGR